MVFKTVTHCVDSEGNKQEMDSKAANGKTYKENLDDTVKKFADNAYKIDYDFLIKWMCGLRTVIIHLRNVEALADVVPTRLDVVIVASSDDRTTAVVHPSLRARNRLERPFVRSVKHF